MAGVGYRSREPGLIHRLDTQTSGLVVAARSHDAFARLRGALTDRADREAVSRRRGGLEALGDGRKHHRHACFRRTRATAGASSRCRMRRAESGPRRDFAWSAFSGPWALVLVESATRVPSPDPSPPRLDRPPHRRRRPVWGPTRRRARGSPRAPRQLRRVDGRRRGTGVRRRLATCPRTCRRRSASQADVEGERGPSYSNRGRVTSRTSCAVTLRVGTLGRKTATRSSAVRPRLQKSPFGSTSAAFDPSVIRTITNGDANGPRGPEWKSMPTSIATNPRMLRPSERRASGARRVGPPNARKRCPGGESTERVVLEERSLLGEQPVEPLEESAGRERRIRRQLRGATGEKHGEEDRSAECERRARRIATSASRRSLRRRTRRAATGTARTRAAYSRRRIDPRRVAAPRRRRMQRPA